MSEAPRTLRQMVNAIALEVDEADRWDRVARDLRVAGLDDLAAGRMAEGARLNARIAIADAAAEIAAGQVTR